MMTNFYRFTSALALAALAVPAASQPRSMGFETSGDISSSRPFMFTGATLRLSLDGRGERKPEVALRFAGGTQTAGLAPRIGDGIAFSMVPGAKPRMSIAGQDSVQLTRRLNMSSGAKAGLIIGGIVVVGALVAVAAGGIGDAPAAAFEDN